MEKVKLCNDCKHFKPARFGDYTEECHRVAKRIIYSVDGKVYDTLHILNCLREREATWDIWWVFGDGGCGKEGRFWEAKE